MIGRYKDKLKNYEKVRTAIFKNSSNPDQPQPKVSNKILKVRQRYQERKLYRQEVESTILERNDDIRPFGKVELFGRTIVGLLDSGSTVTILGNNAIELLKELDLEFLPFHSQVRTADGNTQPIIGRIKKVPLKFRDQEKQIDLLIGPSLNQNLYLGWDFMQAFGLATDLIEPKVEELGVGHLGCQATETESGFQMHVLSEKQQSELDKIKQRFPSYAKQGRGKTHLLQHTIDTGDALPIKQRHYPYSPAIQKKLEQAVDQMLEEGIIQESESGWSSPITPVIKPEKVRLCLDARKVNSVTKPFAYPLPNIGGLLSRLGETVYISSVDLKDAFWQIPLDEASREKTAFTIPGRPLYEFVVMPFGLSNAAQRLCQLMDKVVPSELRDRVFVYLDDLLVFSATFEDHLKLLDIVAKRLNEAGLTINVGKSKFCFKELRYLGYVVGNGTIQTDPKKVEAISSMDVPKTLKQLRSFIGMCSWYRRFIKDFSSTASPLTDCMKCKKGQKFKMTPEAITAFESLKTKLTSAPVLINPDFDKEFVLACDACTTGIGGVLAQVDEDGNERAICFYSHKLNPAQRNYSITELECLAAVMCIKFFRPYIEGHKFRVITDHASLQWLMSQKDLTGRLARWSMKLSQFDFTIEHRKGTLNIVPDALSRSFAESIDLTGESPINLESPEFKSEEYLGLIELISDSQKSLPDLKVLDEHVYKRVKFRTNDLVEEHDCWRLWIPSSLSQIVINNFHSPPNCSHKGFHKTLTRIREFVYWPSMVKDIKLFIKSCDTCKEIKTPNTNLQPEMGKPFATERPFQHVYIDFIGPYPRSKFGNSVIFILLDQFTKFPLAKSFRNATSSNVIRYLKEMFAVFGVPESLLSDNGSQFTSKDFKKFLSDLGIKHCRTGVYAPQSNASERVNRTIIASIRAYINEEHTNWDLHLDEILSSIRSTIHTAIGTSPYKAMFGQGMILHGHLYRLLKNLRALSGEDLSVQSKNDRMQLLRAEIQENLEKAHQRYAKQYNTRSKPRTFQVGQEVLHRNFELSNAGNKRCKKFAKKFLKCRIKSAIANNLYELEDNNGKTLGIYHAKDIIIK